MAAGHLPHLDQSFVAAVVQRDQVAIETEAEARHAQHAAAIDGQGAEIRVRDFYVSSLPR